MSTPVGMSAPRVLSAEPLTAQAFAAFGDVIESEGHEPRAINEGTCRRFDDLARIDVLERGGRALVSVFEADARTMPLRIRSLERHPLSSQAFYPLQPRPFLVVVAPGSAAPTGADLRVFRSSGRQGVNYRRNTWHHALIALEDGARFLVLDRGGDGENCEEAQLDAIVHVDARLVR